MLFFSFFMMELCRFWTVVSCVSSLSFRDTSLFTVTKL